MPFKETLAVLSRVGWLSSQPEDFRSQLLTAADIRTLPPGSALYRLGDEAGGIFGVARGYVDVSIAPEPFPPRLVHVGGAGWWVGEAAAATATARRAEIKTRTDAVVAYVSSATLTRLAEQDPAIWRRLAALTVQHLDDALALAAIFASEDISLRIMATLGRLARVAEAGDAILDIPVTQSDLAELTGLSRNSIASRLPALVSRGILKKRYRSIAVDTVRLRDELYRLRGRWRDT